MFEFLLKKYFSTQGLTLSKSFVRYTSAVISACSFSTHEIARYVSKATGHDFNTSEKGLSYLLNNEKFKVDDSFWRKHINMIFDLLMEQDLIQTSGIIYIQVDFTSNEDEFLILSASIIVNNRSVPLYFTMRNYPRKKDQYDHKLMERAFLKGLRHALSKKYQYVIVADRGFGNDRFLSLCEDLCFKYLIRATPNMKISTDDVTKIMNAYYTKDGTYELDIVSWKKKIIVHKASNKKGEWFLLSNIKGIDHKKAASIYQDRFKIEKCFQDLKSSGFNIEKSKIKKYARYKRLLAMVSIAHALLVMLGHVIVTKLPHFLKNSALMADVILAYFQSEERLIPYLQRDNSGLCLED
jgi:hypothetical protein